MWGLGDAVLVAVMVAALVTCLVTVDLGDSLAGLRFA